MARPRKIGKREPNGKPQRSTAAELNAISRREQLAVKSIAMTNPERRDFVDPESPLAGQPLGRFVMAEKLRMEYFNAGERYFDEVRRWRSAKGLKTLGWVGQGFETEATRDEIEKRFKIMAEAQRALMSCSLAAFSAVNHLVLHMEELMPERRAAGHDGLHALVVHYGLMR